MIWLRGSSDDDVLCLFEELSGEVEIVVIDLVVVAGADEDSL